MDAEKLMMSGMIRDAVVQTNQEQLADDKNLHASGPYVVLGAWRLGLVTAVFEQNTGQEKMNGLTATVTYPAVCVVTGPGGTATCAAHDTELILTLVHKFAVANG